MTHGNLPVVDLRSDTVTRPPVGMHAAMAAAEVGDDVYGDDPTVMALEVRVAGLLSKAAALFFPSGTQSNLAGLLSHCARGEEALVGRGYHVVGAEAAGASVLGGIALTELPLKDDKGVSLEALRAAIKPDDLHYPIGRLLCLENTVAGCAVPLERQDAASAVAREAGLSVHLDAARSANAALVLGVDLERLARSADSVSFCLSKGLGTPAGSLLARPADFIARARRWRKMLGGAMRQSGVLAAAGLYALDNHLPRLSEDHRRATCLRTALAQLPGLHVDLSPNQTNMVLLQLERAEPRRMTAHLAAKGIIIGGRGRSFRLVVHLDVDDAGIARTVEAFESGLRQQQS